MNDGKGKVKHLGPDKPETPQEDYIEPYSLSFIYHGHTEYPLHPEPHTYISHFTGTINLYDKVEDEGIVVGKFCASHVHSDNANEDRVSLGEVMDGYSREYSEIYSTLYNSDTQEIREYVSTLLREHIYTSDLLVIGFVEILPAYRGMGLGLATMWHLIRLHSINNGIVALMVFPFQFGVYLRDGATNDWDKNMAYESFSSRQEVAQAKLVSYCEKLGFRVFGDGGVMALNTALLNPIPEEIHRWIPSSLKPKS